MGEVAMYGNDGDISVSESPFVAVLGGIVADELASEPPVGAPLWVDAFLKAVVPHGICLLTDANAFYFTHRQAWNVHVECDAGWKPVFKSCANNLSNKRQTGFKVGVGTMVEERETD